jgi:hypothetical protein
MPEYMEFSSLLFLNLNRMTIGMISNHKRLAEPDLPILIRNHARRNKSDFRRIEPYLLG